MSDLPEVLAAVTLGPEDRLVLTTAEMISDQHAEEYQNALAEVGLRGRVVIAAGMQAIPIRATKARGSTVGECGHRLEALFAGGTSTYCWLAHGHTGRHSDGVATWGSAEEPV